MRSSPLLRLGLGALAVISVILAALLLTRGGAEAPEAGRAPTQVVPSATNVPPSPTLEPTPAPTADIKAQRVLLLDGKPGLVPIIQAAESGDVEALLNFSVKVHLCETTYHGEVLPPCVDADHVEAVQQAGPHTYPYERPTYQMREWLTQFFSGGSGRLDYAARHLPLEDPGVYVLIFRVAEPRCLSAFSSCHYDKLVLYVSDTEAYPIDQFSFFVVRDTPPYDFEHFSTGIGSNYEVLLGDCNATPELPCVRP